jgi:hypothetical protein
MIFDSKEWELLSRHYPLGMQEITTLGFSIRESAEVACAIVMWGMAIQRLDAITPELAAILYPDTEEKCPHEDIYCNDRSQAVCCHCGEELGR